MIDTRSRPDARAGSVEQPHPRPQTDRPQRRQHQLRNLNPGGDPPSHPGNEHIATDEDEIRDATWPTWVLDLVITRTADLVLVEERSLDRLRRHRAMHGSSAGPWSARAYRPDSDRDTVRGQDSADRPDLASVACDVE